LQRQFGGKRFRLRYYLSPPFQQNPLFEKGEPRKRSYSGKMAIAFFLLAKLKFLRGTPLDPFGYHEERKRERRLIAAYEARMEEILAALNPDNHAAAVAIAALPDMIRGFGHVKLKSIERAGQEEARLLQLFKAGRSPELTLAAE
jgi:indolepyruvate ferredoxin oxidoreductase